MVVDESPPWVDTGLSIVRFFLYTIVFPYLHLILAAIGIFVNTFHILVLTRKSMRSNCTNIILMGIAVADLYYALYKPYEKILGMFVLDKCINLSTWAIKVARQYLSSFSNIFRTLSAYLAVLIATVRLLAIKNAMNSRFDFLSTPKFGIISVAILFAISGSNDLIYWGRTSIVFSYEIEPPEECGFPANYTHQVWLLADPTVSSNLFLFELFTSVSVFLPAAALPVLSILLVRELRKGKKTRSQISKSQSGQKSKFDQATRMITIITLASVIAEGPIGLLLATISFLDNRKTPKLVSFVLSIKLVWNEFVLLNTTTHCFVSLVVSSEYQKAALSLFPCTKWFRKPANLIKVEASNMSHQRASVNSIGKI